MIPISFDRHQCSNNRLFGLQHIQGRRRLFIQHRELGEILSMSLTNFGPRRRSNNRQCGFLATRENLYA